jgi:ankyrin repeat protein
MKGKYFKLFILLQLLNPFSCLAAENGSAEVVKLLLENGAHTEMRNCNENTALIIGNLLNYIYFTSIIKPIFMFSCRKWER